MKNHLRNERGVTMLQAAFFLAAVMAVGGAIFQATQTSKESLDQAKRVGDTGTLSDRALGAMRSLLLDVGPQKLEGSCRLFKTPMKTGGVGNIYLEVPVASNDVLAPDWVRAFPANKWEEVTSSACQKSALRRCLKPKADLGLTPDFQKMEPLVAVSLIPVYMRSTGARAVDPVPASSAPVSVNARDAGFSLSAQVYLKQSQITGKAAEAGAADPYTSVTSTNATVWAGQLTCGFTTPEGRHLSLNPSAIGSGVSGGGMVFSNANVEQVDQDEVFNVNFTQFENTKWKIESGTVKSDYESGAVSSMCREKVFQCRNSHGTRVWEPESLGVEVNVRFIPNTKIAARAVVGKPEIQFRRKDGSSPIRSTNAEYFLNNVPLPAPHDVTFLESPRVVLERFKDSQAICSNVCGGSDFNTGSNPYAPALVITPRSDFSAVGVLEPYVDQVSATACNCCAVKQCARHGYGTKSACNLLPAEPLDSRVAECEAKTDENVYRDSPLFTQDTSGWTASSCVAAKVNRNSITYETKSCTESLPSFCYAQGQYLLTASLDTGALTSSNFDAARAGCYKLGDESLNKSELDRRLTNQNTLTQMAPILAPYVNGTKYRFVNMASAGLFLAPESDMQMSMMQSGAPITGDVTAWIGLRTDETSRLYAPPPELENSFLSTVGYYVEPTKKLVVFSDTSNVTAGNNLLLVHSRKFHGPVSVGDTAPAAAQVLCRNWDTGRLFLATAGSTASQSGASAICRSENGLFLPPLRPLEWHRATLMAATPDPSYPWPNEGGVKNTAWIGYVKNGSDWKLAIAPAAGTAKLNWKGEAATGTTTHRLCSKRTGSALQLKLVSGATAACTAEWTPHGPIKANAIVDNSDILLFLAKKHAAADLTDTSVVDLNAAP